MFFSPVRGDWICRPYQLVEWLKWSGTLKITEITARPFLGTRVRNLANTFPLLQAGREICAPIQVRVNRKKETQVVRTWISFIWVRVEAKSLFCIQFKLGQHKSATASKYKNKILVGSNFRFYFIVTVLILVHKYQWFTYLKNLDSANIVEVTIILP